MALCGSEPEQQRDAETLIAAGYAARRSSSVGGATLGALDTLYFTSRPVTYGPRVASVVEGDEILRQHGDSTRRALVTFTTALSRSTMRNPHDD
jgi:hypothetical protein